MAFKRVTGLVKASCLSTIINICSTSNQDLSRSKGIKLGPTAFFEVRQEDKDPEDINQMPRRCFCLKIGDINIYSVHSRRYFPSVLFGTTLNKNEPYL